MGFASIGTTQTKQRTLTVHGEKIVIKSRNRTWYANPAGFNVWINGEKYFYNVLDRTEAEEKAYCKWVKENK